MQKCEYLDSNCFSKYSQTPVSLSEHNIHSICLGMVIFEKHENTGKKCDAYLLQNIFHHKHYYKYTTNIINSFFLNR